ncbi:DUF547 domain-containing protein [uncultured Algibacter sp.]|uniref:DUF547 domain-containing protein n=1 Tax=uncultured Algibacter sp. TaxID=298659 RepID=UPI002626E608|nr:DUF547 domain-containing protein [uncultured Algibacter sp.]
MKYFSFIFIICFFYACSSTKNATNSTPQKTNISKIVTKTKDTISEKVTTIDTEIKKSDSLVIDYEFKPIKDTIKKPNHDSFTKLLKKYVTNEGLVNYKSFKKEQILLQKYISHLGEIMPTNNWTNNEKLAYWINAYNAMTIDLILRYYPLKSIKDIKKPWDKRFWKLGNKWYNLNEIEHDILRKMNEPRIHFAIVCASYSCPKLNNIAFTSHHLNNQLTKATKEFLSDSNRNEISKNDIKLSKIFQWFSKDFKQNGNLIDFLITYSSVEISEKAKTSFKDYNWDLNE